MNKTKKYNILNNFCIKYSLLFLVMSFITFMWMWLNGRGFIWIHDGYDQHYKALVFYGQYLRTNLSLILHGHSSEISSWSYYLGEGGDILGVLNYYVIGDPLNLLSIFFTPENTHVLYNLLSLIRLYLAGLSFIYLCKTLGRDINSWSVLGGAVSYTFSMWAIHNANVQVIFLSPLYVLPLLIAGAETIINKKKSILFILSVFLAAITNFYFFYNEVLFVVLYVVVRVIVVYKKNFKEYFKIVLNLLWRAIIGVLMAGVILLPSLYAFLGDKRADIDFGIKLFYPESYYLNLPALLVSSLDTAALFQYYFSISAIGIIAICILFFTKKHTELKVFCILGLVFSVFPIFGSLFNGMSYISGKWTFALTLLISYVIVVMWDEMKAITSLNKKAITLLTVSIILFLLNILIKESRIPRSICSCVVLILAVLFVVFAAKKVPAKYLNGCLTGFIVINIALSSFWLNSIGGDNFGAQSRRASEILYDNNINELTAINRVCGNNNFYYRYSGSSINRNLGLITNDSSIGYFWTLTNPDIVNFNTSLGMTSYKLHEYTDYDYRSIPLTLSSTLYYVTEEADSPVPFGFDYVDVWNNGEDSFYVYENTNFLNASYSLDRFIPESTLENLDPVNREYMMLNGLIVEDSYVPTLINSGLYEIRINTNSTCIPYTISYDENEIDVDLENGLITVKKPAVFMELNFESIPDTETYVSFSGLSYLDGCDGFIVLATNDMAPYVQEFHSEGYDFYNGREDFVKNLGYINEAETTLKLGFVFEGTYRLNDLSIYSQDVSSLEEYVNELNSISLQNFQMGSDHISGTYSSDNARLVVISVPYHEGWTAYIDGEETSIIRTNLKYMGIIVPQGTHNIHFEYKTPFLREGGIISILGFILFTSIVIISNIKKGRR